MQNHKTLVDPLLDVNDQVSVDLLRESRLQELKAFLVALRSPVIERQIEDNETFALLMQLAVDDYGVGQKELADVLQTQKSTVGRWKYGQSAPSTYSRSGVISAIATLVESHILARKPSDETT